MIDQLSLVKIAYVCSKIFIRLEIYFQPYENLFQIITKEAIHCFIILRKELNLLPRIASI